ncbi:hypothetical protein [Photobacterium leiognathi]|uniref:hypothetical protein n=1 Tax=Photobacterium leiognathi TaxID=553611 RepID=UPI002738E760|nr:hypothetical protein [Photobacterium leiognathi]
MGLNGLDSNYEAADDYTDVNGTFDNTQTDNFPDLDNDVFTGGDVDWRDASNPDSDYGDAPDAGAGFGIGNYRTLASDIGAFHYNPIPTTIFW